MLYSQTSTNPVFRAVGDAMIEFNKTDPSVMAVDVNEQLAKVRQGGYGWIGGLMLLFLDLSLYIMKTCPCNE